MEGRFSLLTGAQIGGLLGPEGAAVGAVVGGVISGVQASTEAAARQTTTLGVIAGSSPSIDPANARNSFDTTKSFEEKTLADKGLTEQERQSLLSGFSVARYSAAYWGDQAARQQSSPWCGCSK